MSKIRLLALVLLTNMAVACTIDPLPTRKDGATDVRGNAVGDSGSSLNTTDTAIGPSVPLDSGVHADTATGTPTGGATR